jgi:hypothetical protein
VCKKQKTKQKNKQTTTGVREECRVFGVPLTEVMSRHTRDELVPSFVYTIIEYLRREGWSLSAHWCSLCFAYLCRGIRVRASTLEKLLTPTVILPLLSDVITQVGLFRLAGSQATILELRKKIDAGEDIDPDAVKVGCAVCMVALRVCKAAWFLYAFLSHVYYSNSFPGRVVVSVRVE